MFLAILCAASYVLQIHSSKILTVIPTPFYSHQFALQPLWNELSSRGHELTVMTTNPQKNESEANIREIDLSFNYEFYEDVKFDEHVLSQSKKYIKVDAKAIQLAVELQRAQLALPEVQKLIHNEDLQFDLLIVEGIFPGMLYFAWWFQIPIIVILPFDCTLDNHIAAGNPIHPLLYPDNNLQVGNVEDMTFVDRLFSFINVALFNYFCYNNYYKQLNDVAKQYFGKDPPPLVEIQNNLSLLMIGTHPLIHKPRPINPNTITIGGGMHLEKPKPLPQDLKQFLDGAEDGAIFFSLGSFLKSKALTTEFMTAIKEAFAQIPYKVLMKVDIELEGISENVLVKKWMPQLDVLRHPNLKLFITHGGILSIQEALFSDVPFIGIPFFGDQFINIDRMVRNENGIKINKDTITKDILVSAINEVMNNPKYQKKAEELGEIYRDEEISSLQRAVYWTEYVIRHKGARHLRSPATGMPDWKYFMLDVFGFLTLVALLIIFMSCLLLKFLYKTILTLYRGNENTKQKMN